MLRLALLADDLTGACDAGVQFSERGFSSIVLIGKRTPKTEEADLVIYNSNSRNDPPEVAREKVVRVCQDIYTDHRTMIFKKVDSTLRGNLGVEIHTAMTNWNTSLAVLAPAFPAMGRTLKDGWLMEAGGALCVPIHLPTLLHQQGATNVVHFNQSVFQDGLKGVIKQLRTVLSDKPQIDVVDTVAQSQLSLIAQAAMSLEPPPLIVGSAGIASEVASILATAHHKKNPVTSRAAMSPPEPSPVVLFIGSDNPATTAQIEYLLSNHPTTCLELQNYSRSIAQYAIGKQLNLVVIVDRAGGKRRVSELASLVCELACGGFILSGGDTAHLICKALNVEGIKLEREVTQGLPWGRFLGGPAAGLPVVTKAGGFGSKEALVAAVEFLSVCGRLQNDNGSYETPDNSN
jgi:uncharacterized protein YgbK (DUF1537 family)